MNDLKEYKFDSIYELVSLVDGHVKSGSEFGHYDEEIFVNCATKFSKFTLLHLYTITKSLDYHWLDFKKSGNCIGEDEMEHWYNLFETYDVKYKKFDFEKIGGDILDWYERSENPLNFELRGGENYEKKLLVLFEPSNRTRIGITYWSKIEPEFSGDLKTGVAGSVGSDTDLTYPAVHQGRRLS